LVHLGPLTLRFFCLHFREEVKPYNNAIVKLLIYDFRANAELNRQTERKREKKKNKVLSRYIKYKINKCLTFEKNLFWMLCKEITKNDVLNNQKVFDSVSRNKRVSIV
jgi:hypothetical protein